MYVVKKIRGLLIAAVLLLPSSSFASPACRAGRYLQGPDSNASLRISEPAMSNVLSSRDVELFVVFELESDLVRDTLDHIHYGFGASGSGVAEQGAFTMPDLLGRITFELNEDAGSGEYTVCSWLARADHSLLSEMDCSTFTLALSGITVFTPRNSREYTSADVDVEFELFGSELENWHYRIDDGEAVTLPAPSMGEKDQLPGEISINLSNGEHKIEAWATDSEGNLFGDSTIRYFLVDSELNLNNARKVSRLAVKLFQTDNLKSRNKLRKKSLKILKKMLDGGGSSPDNEFLTNSNLTKVNKLLKKKKLSNAKERKIKTLLKKMTRG